MRIKLLRTHAKRLGATNVNKSNKHKVISFSMDYKP